MFHYRFFQMAEVKQVARGGWNEVFFLKLLRLLNSFLHHLGVSLADARYDGVTQALLLLRDIHSQLSV